MHILCNTRLLLLRRIIQQVILIMKLFDFKQISKPVVNALHRDLKNKFSTIYWFRVLAEGYFIIQIIHPNESDESRNDIFFDIVSFDGKIIKEKLIFENIGFLTKIADGTFMTITYLYFLMEVHTSQIQL